MVHILKKKNLKKEAAELGPGWPRLMTFQLLLLKISVNGPVINDHRVKWGPQWKGFIPGKCPQEYVTSRLIDFSLVQFRSVQFSHSVMSDSLRPHESQHARPPCPSPSPRVHSNSHPSSRWCHPAISSSIIPFSACPQSLLASESFPMSQLFALSGQSIGVSALASILPKNSQGWYPLEWTTDSKIWIFSPENACWASCINHTATSQLYSSPWVAQIFQNVPSSSYKCAHHPMFLSVTEAKVITRGMTSLHNHQVPNILFSSHLLLYTSTTTFIFH